MFKKSILAAVASIGLFGALGSAAQAADLIVPYEGRKIPSRTAEPPAPYIPAFNRWELGPYVAFRSGKLEHGLKGFNDSSFSVSMLFVGGDAKYKFGNGFYAQGYAGIGFARNGAFFGGDGLNQSGDIYATVCGTCGGGQGPQIGTKTGKSGVSGLAFELGANVGYEFENGVSLFVGPRLTSLSMSQSYGTSLFGGRVTTYESGKERMTYYGIGGGIGFDLKKLVDINAKLEVSYSHEWGDKAQIRGANGNNVLNATKDSSLSTFRAGLVFPLWTH